MQLGIQFNGVGDDEDEDSTLSNAVKRNNQGLRPSTASTPALRLALAAKRARPLWPF